MFSFLQKTCVFSIEQHTQQFLSNIYNGKIDHITLDFMKSITDLWEYLHLTLLIKQKNIPVVKRHCDDFLKECSDIIQNIFS